MSSRKPERAGSLRRTLDFFIGVPIICLIGFFRNTLRRKRDLPTVLKNIGLIQIAAIGDTVLMSAVWRDLCERFPKARIQILVGESNYEVSKLLFGEENIQLLPVKQPFRSLMHARKLQFDCLIDFGPWPRWNAFLAASIPALYRIGYETPGQYRHYAYDHAVPHSDARHELDNQRALTEPLGVPGIHLPYIFPPAHEGFKSPVEKAYAVFHPWAGGFQCHLREWSSENWIELGRRLSELGIEIYVSGSPFEVEKAMELVRRMLRDGLRAESLAGKVSLSSLVTILKGAFAVVSVNTGIMHIAAATGVRTLGLHGPTNARRWGPIGPQAIAIESPGKGCGFLNLGFEYPKEVPPCMQGITVDAVWESLQAEIRN